MKLCNIIVDGAVHTGLITGRGVVDATAAGFDRSVDEVIAAGVPEELYAIEKNDSLPLVEAPEYANILNKPGKLVCIGLNYKAHTEGIKMKLPKEPIIFSKFTDSLVPHGASIELPEWEDSYDYEAELVLVMGKKAWNVSKEEAMDYVFGYSCGNDLSCRDAQMRSGQWIIGKCMPGFGPCGPCIVTADSYSLDPGKQIRCYVNGELRQNDSTDLMIFDCPTIISYASRYVALEPGDIIYTGTPSGVIMEKSGEEQVWLKKGDRLDVEIEGIGTLTNYLK